MSILFDRFMADLTAKHDIRGHEFVAEAAWNAAIKCAVASCEIVENKCDDNDNGFGSNAAGDCADAIRGNYARESTSGLSAAMSATDAAVSSPETIQAIHAMLLDARKDVE